MGAFVVFECDGEKKRVECGQLLAIGRGSTNDIVLREDKVSRNHAFIRCLGSGKYYVMDAGSANGTVVNGRRIVFPRALGTLDEVRVGSRTLTFFLEDEEQAHADELGIDTESTMVTMDSVVEEIAILVVDIRGYTALSEAVPVHFLGTVLGRWFRAANDIVEANGGVVDKFIGDAVMACWAMGGESKKNVIRSVLSAGLEMNRALQEVNAEFSGLPWPMQIGMGINAGQAVMGTMGATSKRDYTAIGDSVNLAFRLESESKTLSKDVVIASDCCEFLSSEIKATYHAKVTVKGSERVFDVCAFTFDELDKLLA